MLTFFSVAAMFDSLKGHILSPIRYAILNVHSGRSSDASFARANEYEKKLLLLLVVADFEYCRDLSCHKKSGRELSFQHIHSRCNRERHWRQYEENSHLASTQPFGELLTVVG